MSCLLKVLGLKLFLLEIFVRLMVIVEYFEFCLNVFVVYLLLKNVCYLLFDVNKVVMCVYKIVFVIFVDEIVCLL